MSWTLQLRPRSLTAPGRQPVFLRIAQAIVRDIRRGRLEPGSRLPGTRSLSEQLGVHRNTVLAAYDELRAQGWLLTEPARGTFVNRELPESVPRGARVDTEGRTRGTGSRGDADAPGVPDRPPYRLGRPPAALPAMGILRPNTISLSGGLPDARLVPVDVIGRAMRRAVARRGHLLLRYGDPWGVPELRHQIARMVSTTRGIAANADHVMITRGSQMGLYLVARTLLRPGDCVAVEAFGYPPAWTALRSAGAKLVPVGVDGEGVRVADVDALSRRRRLRAIYVTPHHQYPTTVTLSAPRRLQLLELARKRRFAIIEDDYDHEFHYRGRPVLPLAAEDDAGAVIYVGTLSKILAPGLRIGYVIGPRPLLERLVATRLHIDRQGDQIGEAAIAELFEDGEIQRHARRVRRIYQSRRDALLAALREHLPEVSCRLPDGGLALWAKTPPGIDPALWSERAEQRGVLFHPGRAFAFRGRPTPYVRLGFAAHTEDEIAAAVKTAATCA